MLIGDPIWSLAKKEAIRFTGNDKFYFFDRNVGVGDAITVAFAMTPEHRANTLPIARVPKTGDAGWAVQLTEHGQIIFRVGSSARHQAVIVDANYPADKETHVACVFDKGTARVYVNGELKKTESGIPFTVKDATAAGRLGAVNNLYEAVGDVIVHNEDADVASARSFKKYHNFVGELRDVRIHNRALSDKEIAAMNVPFAKRE